MVSIFSSQKKLGLLYRKYSYSLGIGAYLSILLFAISPFSYAHNEWQDENRQVLVTITTDLNDDLFPIEIFSDHNGNMTGGKVNQDFFPADIFIEKIQNGLTLSEHRRTRVVVLEGPHMNASLGGSMELRYLTDIIFRKYRKFRMSLERERDGNRDQWSLYTQSLSGEPVKIKDLHIKVRTFFGLPIGIKSILINRK